MLQDMDDLHAQIQAELENARRARAGSKEGQARVCARRAAGIAAREYLIRQGIRPPSASAYDLLNLLKEDPRLSPELRRIADHLTLRVTEEFKLPVDADLIAEARYFCDELLKNKTDPG
jgi:HEPN domain-containing protein